MIFVKSLCICGLLIFQMIIKLLSSYKLIWFFSMVVFSKECRYLPINWKALHHHNFLLWRQRCDCALFFCESLLWNSTHFLQCFIIVMFSWGIDLWFSAKLIVLFKVSSEIEESNCFISNCMNVQFCFSLIWLNQWMTSLVFFHSL